MSIKKLPLHKITWKSIQTSKALQSHQYPSSSIYKSTMAITGSLIGLDDKADMIDTHDNNKQNMSCQYGLQSNLTNQIIFLFPFTCTEEHIGTSCTKVIFPEKVKF